MFNKKSLYNLEKRLRLLVTSFCKKKEIFFSPPGDARAKITTIRLRIEN